MSMISMHFLPGEKAISTKLIADGVLTLTNYRLIFSTKRPQSSWSIPTNLVWKVEIFEMSHIKIITKIGISVTWSFVDEISCDAGYNHITSLIESPRDIESLFACEFRLSLEANIPNHPFLLNACELLQINDVDKALDTALVCFEFRRMNFDKTWKITDINNEFKICSTYPRHHIVPRSISDNDIINMASFRSHNRFLTVVWRSQVTGAVLLRCAQPCVGLMCSRNEYDEKFLRTVLACCPKKSVSNPNKDTHRLMIVDARSRSSAQFNRIRGGGFEYPEYYDQAEVVFMDLPNLHTVRSNFEALTNLFAGKCPNWFSSLEKSSWLTNIGQLLKTATEIAIALEENARPVMVHCTDGWDRTPQISSLAQLLADPFYRTIQGFNILVEREWLQFGHKFGDRSGHVSSSLNINEQSPIFLQWLDCVHQIHKQFSHCFEFNESFLLKLGLHICSNLFGTFLCNSEQEREKASIASRTCSLWGLLSPKYNWTILNYFYEPDAEHLLQPDCQIRSLSLWSAFYGIALSTGKVNSSVEMSDSVFEKTPITTQSMTNSIISSPTKYKSLSSIDPMTSKTDSISDVNYGQLVQPTSYLLNDEHQPSDSFKVTVPNLKIDTTEEIHPNIQSLVVRSTSNRNSRHRSFDDLNNSASAKQQSKEFSLSNRNSPTLAKSSSQCFFEGNLCNEKISSGPAILRLSSLSDDTGICSGLSKSYMRSLTSVTNGSCPFPEHPNKCMSPGSNAQLTIGPCTYVNHFQQQECVLSADETIDVFASDEQLAQNNFTFNNHNNVDNIDNHTNNLRYSGRLYYSQFSQPIQNCQFYGKCSPLSISPRNFEFNDCEDNNHDDNINIESRSKMLSNFHLDGVQSDNFAYNSPRWSITTRGSNTSLYVLSDMKQSSAELLKPALINSSHPMDIKIPHKSDNPNSLIPLDNGSIYSSGFTVHSLPENDEVLVNGTESLTCDSYNSPNECSDLNLPTPLGESTSRRMLYTNKNEVSDFDSSNNSDKFQDINGSVSIVNEINQDEAFTTKLFELLIPEDLLAWRNKYFRSEYFPNKFSQSSSLSCDDRNSSSDQMCDYSGSNNDSTSRVYKLRASFDSNSHSVMVNPKVSLPEFNRIVSDEDNIHSRSTSAPITPASVGSFSSPTLCKNVTPSNSSIQHPSLDQKISNANNGLEEIQKKSLSSALMSTLSWFPDWDGLPMLVDRLTIHAHSQLCQERYNRKTQKQSVLALEAKLKYTQLEVERLNSETTRLKQLLDLTNTRTSCKQQETNMLASSGDHLSSLSSLLSSYEQTFTQNTHSSKQCKSKECGLLTGELYISIEKDENISEEDNTQPNFKSCPSDSLVSQPIDPIESSFLDATRKTTSFELIDTEDGQSVLLQPDCIARQCTLCRIEFSPVRPKHHCRNCGYIFCANCSDRRIVIPSQPSEPVRVCRHCYFQLSRSTVKSSKQQLIGEFALSVPQNTVVRKDDMKDDNAGSYSGLVKNFTNPDFLDYISNSIVPSSDTGCISVSSCSNEILRLTSNGDSHYNSGSLNLATTNNSTIITPVNHHRFDSLITNNPPLSRCHSAGGTRPTSSAASDGIAQA